MPAETTLKENALSAANPKTVVFDIGNVLLRWDPRHLYRRIFDDEAEMEWFLENVCTHDWNVEQDRGRDWEEAVALLVKDHPKHETQIRAFHDRYKARTGRWPVIYTSTSWWSQCVSGDFSSTNPLWVARYSSAVGTLPFAWPFHTIWQYSSTPIDQNQFNGGYDRLQALATG